MKLHFRTALQRCPACGLKLISYKTKRRRVVSSGCGDFTAVSHIMRCRNKAHGIFMPDPLNAIVSPNCTYANDIMIDAAMEMFIDGRSSSEVSFIKSTGISSRHVRRLANIGLSEFGEIHKDATERLRKSMASYILQIDGTTDSEYSMIVVVKDSISGFVLYVKRCYSESEESIKSILNEIKKRFGIPAGITCDMRKGIISAAGNVFPGVPIRICLMHFLRDLGKDLMEQLHKDLGIAINRTEIKSPLKAIMRSMPGYDQGTLDEIESGYCSNRRHMEMMSIRRILEHVSIKGSSGYGFPFSLKHLNFFLSCRNAVKKLSILLEKMKEQECIDLTSQILAILKKVTDNASVVDIAEKLHDINSLIFSKIRNAFIVPDRGNLSDDRYDSIRDDPGVHEACAVIFGEIEVYLNADIPVHLKIAANIALERYHNREKMLFANNPEHPLPRTNNNMEIFFRRIRRNIRKRCGNINTGNMLTQRGESLALFQNMSNEKYREIVFGKEDISTVFAKYRKPFVKNEMTRKRKIELVNKGTEMILNDSLPDTPYNEETMAAANAFRLQSNDHPAGI